MTYRTAIKLLAVAIFATGWLVGVARADMIGDIRNRGELVVGVRPDYPPYGFRDPSGEIVGLEVDLANDVAKRLGVKLRLEPVVASNRMQYVQQGKIDLMMATMNVNDERKKAVGVIEPYYYASSVAILAQKSANIKSVTDLQSKPVCVIQSSFFNRDVQKMTGRDLVTFKSVLESEQALRNGQCVGFVYDDTRLMHMKSGERWKDFDIVQLDIPPLPWGAAVKSEERDTAWGKFMSEIIKDWHKNGTLVEAEKKWLGQNTKWLLDQQAAAK